MYTIYDIYVIFRQSQSMANNRPYKLPKNWEKHYSKMSELNKKNLSLITNFFNTKWRTIDPVLFFNCGFELFSSFSYSKFFDKRIINLYISKDKNEKRNLKLSKKEIIKSAKFIKKYMIENEIETLKNYAWKRDNFIHICINHYLHNKINSYIIVYMMIKKYLILENEETMKIPYVIEKFREIKREVLKIKKFIEKMEDNLNNVKK